MINFYQKILSKYINMSSSFKALTTIDLFVKTYLKLDKTFDRYII
jgi:hypothetical protein